jgi:hypothetical protein
LTYVIVQRLLLAGSLVGLMYYLVYLLTGRDILLPLVAFYGAYYAFQIYTVMAGAPTGVDVYRWRTDLAYSAESPSWWQLINLVAIILPPVIGCARLLRVGGKLDDRSKRIRATAVSLGFIVWWLVAILAGQRGALDIDGLQIMNRILGLAVALTILFAYQPTGWLQRRMRIEPYGSA